MNGRPLRLAGTVPAPVRKGFDLLRLGDGSLRAVLECLGPAPEPAGLLGVAAAAVGTSSPSGLQVTYQARHESTSSLPVLERLRASYETLLTTRGVPTRRVLVVVGPGPGATDALAARVDAVHRCLADAGLVPARVRERDLDALLPPADIEEGWSEVRASGRLGRTLILTGDQPPGLDNLDELYVDHDLAIHVRLEDDGSAWCRGYLTLWAARPADLDDLTKQAQATLGERGAGGLRTDLEALPAYLSCLPLGLDLCDSTTGVRVADIEAPPPERRLLYGIDPGRGTRHLVDRLALSNPIAVVLGDWESGKSRLLMLDVLRGHVRGYEVHVIDPTGEHAPIVQALGGEVCELRPDRPAPFAPFAVPPGTVGALSARLRSLEALLEVLAGSLDEAQSTAVRAALAFAFAAHGYTDEANLEGLTPPHLGEVLESLKGRLAGVDFEDARRKLDRYVTGEGSWLLAADASPTGLAPVRCFSLVQVPEEDVPATALLTLDHLTARPVAKPTLVVLDEVWDLLTCPAVSAIFEQVKRHGIALTLACSDVRGVLRRPPEFALTDAGLMVLLQQAAEAVPAVASAFHLTPAEQTWLAGAAPGEGLLLTEGQRRAFRTVVSEDEARLIEGGGRRWSPSTASGSDQELPPGGKSLLERAASRLGRQLQPWERNT